MSLLFPCVFYPQYIQLPLIKSNAPQHKSVAFESFYGVDTHTAHHLFYFMRPGGDKVDKSVASELRIQPVDKTWYLSSYTPISFT